MKKWLGSQNAYYKALLGIKKTPHLAAAIAGLKHDKLSSWDTIELLDHKAVLKCLVAKINAKVSFFWSQNTR